MVIKFRGSTTLKPDVIVANKYLLFNYTPNLNQLFYKTPAILRKLFSSLLWKIESKEKAIYLTFDDGPTPEITPWVLDVLEAFDAKATFFCIGKNVQAYPEIFQAVIKSGHAVGNHTHNHLNGWKTTAESYLENTTEAAKHIDSKLFRPPYGKVSLKQIRLLKKAGYTIVMWEVVSADFDQDLSPENCFQNLLRHTKPGSIVVFHDSLKAAENLKTVLPRMLAYFADKGFVFKPLTPRKKP